MKDELMILTPEKTVVTFRFATIGNRVLAHLIDLLLVLILVIGWSIWVHIPYLPAVIRNTLSGPIELLILFGYFILLEGLWNGFTVGKKAMNIRVCMVDGTPITFIAAIGRNLLRLADFLPSFYFLGFMVMFTTSDSQRIGDLISQTIVVHDRLPVLAGYVEAPHHAGIHPYEAYVGQLSGMTSAEYEALRRLCDRFPELPTKIQNKMIKEIWLPFAENHRIQPVQGLHPLYLAEATVMKYGREKGLL